MKQASSLVCSIILLQVQRHRKRESEAGTKADPILAPPVKAQPPIAVPEKKAVQEPVRPPPTLAEAAGLNQAMPSQELEAATAPWSSVHPGKSFSLGICSCPFEL